MPIPPPTRIDYCSRARREPSSIHNAKSGARRIPADSFLLGAFTPQLDSKRNSLRGGNSAFLAGHALGLLQSMPQNRRIRQGHRRLPLVDARTGTHRVLAGALNGRPLLLPKTSERLKQNGADQASGMVRDEIDDLLAHLDAAHRQQLTVAVQRSSDPTGESAEFLTCRR